MKVSLKADHGQYVCAEEGGGDEGQIVAGRQAGLLTATRAQAGAWETFDVVNGEGDTVGLRSSGGYFACAENAGLDRVVVCNRRVMGAWEQWHLRHRDGTVAFESAVRPGHYIKAWPDGRVTLDQPMFDGRPSDVPGPYESYVVAGLSTGVVLPSLTLPVRAGAHGWRDARGTRPILGASWFPALRILRDDPQRFAATLAKLQAWGVSVVRTFAFVAHPDYWESRGRSVLATDTTDGRQAWPDYDTLVVTFAQALRDLGMAWFVTAGDLQYSRDPGGVYRRVIETLERAGLLDVVAVGDVNEPWQNGTGGDDNPQLAARWLQPFAARGLAWSPGCSWQEDATYAARVNAPVETMHGPGNPHDLMVRHIYNHRHEGARWARALMQGEPRGPGRDVSAGRVDAQGWIALAAAMSAMTGQLYVLHTSRGIRDLDDDDPWETFAPYFQRSAAMLSHLPQSDVVLTAHGGRGGTADGALFASTRADGLFYGDATGVRDQFHRCDAVRFANGQRAALLYGGEGDREARVVTSIHGVFINTRGDVVRQARDYQGGSIVRFSNADAGDGLLFVA